MIGAIARAHGDDPGLVARLSAHANAAFDDFAACGTPACGLHHERCDHCGSHRLAPNTCGNRSCPHCQGAARADWVAAREREMLPGIGCYHAVFTVPPEIGRIARFWPVVVLGAMLRASADVIITLCHDPTWLGAEVGLVEVLHTWTRDLRWHPHVHQIVTAGGWDAEAQRWVPARRHGPAQRAFLLPLPVLRKAYQARLVALLITAYEDGAFDTGPWQVFPELASLADFRRHLGAQARKRWCIRIEPPFSSPQCLLKYLGAYVNRVALSPQRIIAHDPAANDGAGSVTWTYVTNAEPGRVHTRVQTGVEFLAAFAQHILPPRMVRIRFRGLWCTAHRRSKLDCARAWLLANQPPPPEPSSSPGPSTPTPATDAPAPVDAQRRCPICGIGTFQRLPGPCPRPSRQERRRLLTEIRHQERAVSPVEGHAPA